MGRTLSHDTVLEEISRGGMGIVYKALDLKLNRDVALKVLPLELVSDADTRGFCIGARGRFEGVRSAPGFGEGLDAGITTSGEVYIGLY